MSTSKDLAGARAALEGAVAAATDADRAQALLNLAHIVALMGDRRHAVDLMTEALPLAAEPLRALVIASRADLRSWLDRWDEAWQEVEAALGDAGPAHQVGLRNNRVGLLVMAGRLEEAEADATATVELAVQHAPEYLTNLYVTLAALADEAGDEQRAARYRLLGENDGQNRSLGPRWLRFVELNTDGVVLASSGDRPGAIAAYEAAYRETVGADDLAALACRAAVTGNLASVVGDHDQVLRWSTESITAARAALVLGDDGYGIATVLVNSLVCRSIPLHARMRLPESLADLDEAVALLAEVDDRSVEATVRATRARVLVVSGRFADAAAEARTALELAYAAAPTLAAAVHSTLAEITSGTGDLAGAVEHLAMARDLCAAAGDAEGEATAVLSSARLAYLASDGDRADTLYAEAEGLLADNPRWLALCLIGRAAVAVLRGRPGEAVGMLDRSMAALGSSAITTELVAVHQVRGSAFESLGEYAAAESSYTEAADLCEASGLWHVALGMAWWRTDALVRRAAAVTGDERRAIARRALDLGLPAALAAEAVRQRFPHGPLRERWVALASAPATRSAFLAIRAVEDSALAAEYIDHLAGAVTLTAGDATPVERTELVSLPAPPMIDQHLPYAAAGFGSGTDPAFPMAGFALPPRVRFDPAVPSTLDFWIDVAEERYGFPVRAAGAVVSW